MIVEVIFGAAVGLVLGAILWQIADQQIRDRLFSPTPLCVDCGSPVSILTWSPVPARTSCTSCGQTDNLRLYWLAGTAVYFAAVMSSVDAWRDRSIVVTGALMLLLILAVDLKSTAVFVVDCYLAIAVSVGLALIEGPASGVSALIGIVIAVLTTAFFLVISRWILRSISLHVSPIGKSDLYVAAAAGAFATASNVVPTLVFAVLLAGLIGVGLPIFAKRFRTQAIPFGPCLIVGALLTQVI